MIELALIGFNIYTAHTHTMCADINPGIYIETTDGIVLGAYRNSECHLTTHVGYRLPSIGPVDFHAGVMTGYSRAKLTPYLLPSISLPANFRLTWIPQKRQAFHLSWEHRF